MQRRIELSARTRVYCDDSCAVVSGGVSVRKVPGRPFHVAVSMLINNLPSDSSVVASPGTRCCTFQTQSQPVAWPIEASFANKAGRVAGWFYPRHPDIRSERINLPPIVGNSTAIPIIVHSKVTATAILLTTSSYSLMRFISNLRPAARSSSYFEQ